jgi:ABC-type polysaccharide/polyol phosphate export permease
MRSTHFTARVHFPCEALPLSRNSAAVFDTLIAGAVGTALATAASNSRWTPLPSALAAALLSASMLAIGLIAGCSDLSFRNVPFLMRLLVTVGVFPRVRSSNRSHHVHSGLRTRC